MGAIAQSAITRTIWRLLSAGTIYFLLITAGERLYHLVTMAENVPPVEDAKRFAFSCFKSLSGTGQVIRRRLCEKIDAALVATADGEDSALLRAAAYLQEV